MFPKLAKRNNKKILYVLVDAIPNKVNSEEIGSIVAAKKLIKKKGKISH